MEDALAFWKTEFMKGGKTEDEFEKKYSYNFKHQYGQEGSRKNYRPHACGKVIGASPDASGATGCPFRTCKSDALAQALGKMSLKGDVATAVVGKAREGHFQVACTMVYEARHEKLGAEGGVQHPNQYFREGGVQHPNQYFRESREYYKEKEANE